MTVHLDQQTRDHLTRQLATAASLVAVNPISPTRLTAALLMLQAAVESLLRADTERREDKALVATMRARGVECGPLEARLRMSVEAGAANDAEGTAGR